MTLAKKIVSDVFDASPGVIEVGAITLRALSVEDASAVHAYASDPEVARFTLWPSHSSEEFTREFLAALPGAEELSRTGEADTTQLNLVNVVTRESLPSQARRCPTSVFI